MILLHLIVVPRRLVQNYISEAHNPDSAYDWKQKLTAIDLQRYPSGFETLSSTEHPEQFSRIFTAKPRLPKKS